MGITIASRGEEAALSRIEQLSQRPSHCHAEDTKARCDFPKTMSVLGSAFWGWTATLEKKLFHKTVSTLLLLSWREEAWSRSLSSRPKRWWRVW